MNTSVNLLMLIVLFVFSAVCINAQTPHFDRIVMRCQGDLNKDKIPDLVVVRKDTSLNPALYQLEIFFKQGDGSMKKVVSSQTVIEPARPDLGIDLDTVTINNNVLTIGVQLTRGHYEHKFRYQNGHFELIGFHRASSDGQGVLETIDFNLSTGVCIEQREHYDTDKLISKQQKEIKISPLPSLDEFTPFKEDFYERL